MLNKILVPLDGSGFSEHALGIAVSLAKRSGASITLAIVEVPPPMAFPDVNFLEPLSAVEERYLVSVADQIREAGLDNVSVKVLTGNVPEALERYRAKVGAGLTVMATHGRGPMARAWMGSVADRFARSTSAPVLLVRPGDDDEGSKLDDLPAFGHVAVTLDGSELSETAIDPALVLADLFDADLTLVRVVEYPHTTESIYIPDAIDAIHERLEQSRKAAHVELERVADRLAAEGRQVRRETDVVHHAAAGILQVVRDIGADVVVMASHGRGGLGRVVLGSVADKVLRGSDRPVLLVHAKG